MPPASKRECHMKWCDQMDQAQERMHMALREAGEPAMLVRRESDHCGKEHLYVRFWDYEAPSDEVCLQAMRVAMPAEMFEDFLVAFDGIPWRRNPGAAERVR